MNEPVFKRKHYCQAIGCKIAVRVSRLMCKRHWFMVPHYMRRKVWQTWDNGKGILTGEYYEAAQDAIKYVAKQEGHEHIENLGRD